MIISKSSLEAYRISKTDKLPITIDVNGAVYGKSRKAVFAASPVAQDVRENTILKDIRIKDSLSITAATAAIVYKDLPKDTMFSGLLEHTDISMIDCGVRFVSSDGRRERSYDASIVPDNIDPSDVLNSASHALWGDSSKAYRMVLNRKRLMDLLDCLNHAASDSTGESPVWIAITPEGDVALRCINFATKQRFLAFMRAYNIEEGVDIPPDTWEKGWDKSKKKPFKRRKK